MGTNYSWRHNICECCGRYDELHICKSFRTFRGHFGEEWNGRTMRSLPIVSWQGWKTKLLSGGEVWDEYGQRRNTDVFIEEVESVSPADRRKHHDYCVEHYPPGAIGHRAVGVGPDMQWLCPDGFSFYGGEFS